MFVFIELKFISFGYYLVIKFKKKKKKLSSSVIFYKKFFGSNTCIQGVVQILSSFIFYICRFDDMMK